MTTILVALIAALALAVLGLAYRWLFRRRRSRSYKDYIDAGRAAKRNYRHHPW